MVERLFRRDLDDTSTSNRKCNVTNLITEKDSFSDDLPRPVEYDLLPTINENLEGFQSTASDQEAILRTRFRVRRNSHPISFREGQARTNSAAFRIPHGGGRKCKQSQTKCRKCNSRDPMLSFKILPKQDNIVFDKHKLDKIEEGDSMTELNEEDNAECEDESCITRHIIDMPKYSANMGLAGRRSSYPNDSATSFQQGNSLAHGIRNFTQCQEDIVSKWMKFF